MDKLKKIIIILILILIICITVLLIAVVHNRKEKIKNEENIYNQSNVDEIAKIGFTEVKDYKTYYTVREIINNYIMYMKQINGDENIETGKLNMTEDEIKKGFQEEGILGMKSILDKQYIDNLSVDSNKIILEQNKYKINGNYNKIVMYNLNIKSMAETYIDNNLTIILVNSKLNNIDFNIIIKLDNSNNTFSLYLEDYMKQYNYNKDMDKKDINISKDRIEKNDYNSHIKVNISDDYIISQIFSDYRMKMLNDTKNAYELLDEEYKKRKYGSYENFKSYVDNNREKIEYTSISKYQINEYNGVKEYVCIDKNGKYYIFTENSILDYGVILDTYTVDLPSFLDKYNNNNSEIKGGMNIQKIFDAISDGDYNYVYSKLDDTFKKNNFSNEKIFEKYAKQNLLGKKIEYNGCKKSGELYIYDVIISNEAENNKNVVTKKFIVKLLDGTDFVMSFNIK